MANYNYIHVSLTEQGASSLTTIFNYGSTERGDASTSRHSGAPVPGQIFDYFLNARECYVQWTTQEGNYIEVIFRNPFASHDGFYMITLMAKRGTGLTGRQTVRVLAALRKKLVEERRTTDEAVDEVLGSCGVPREPKNYDSWRIEPTYQFRADAPACYRTFVSTQELETCFTFLRQEEYDRYSRVIYVAATTSLRPGVELQHVIKPIRNVYTIDTPQGAEVSRKAASAGDRVMITYHRQGFAPLRETVVVGRPSMYVTYDGAVMHVKSASDCRLTFVRRIPLEVRSAKGGPVVGYTMTVNGRQVSTMEPFVEITEQDLKSPNGITIAISSTNFETFKIECSGDELHPDSKLEAELVPVEQGITLRLDFGEGRIFEIAMKCEKNTPEYSSLHAGQFHGFRAHRLMVPGRGEIYNVDLRSPGRPVAPNFPKVEERPNVSATESTDDTNPPTRPVAPDITPILEDPAGIEQGRRRSERRRWNFIGLICGIVLLVGVLAVAIVYFFPSWNGIITPNTDPITDNMPDTATVTAEDTHAAVTPVEIVPEQKEGETRQEETEPKVAPTDQADPADYIYLNTSSVWVRDSLHSESARRLYDAIAAGDIPAMASHPYFSTKGVCNNAEALRMIDMLWKAHGTSTEKSNQRCMTRNAEGGKLNLHNLYEEAARYKSPTPNPEPRPERNL